MTPKQCARRAELERLLLNVHANGATTTSFYYWLVDLAERQSVLYGSAAKELVELYETVELNAVNSNEIQMAEQRTVMLVMDAVTQARMCELTDGDMWTRAVGYLSTWNMTYPDVQIYADGETDMTAVYRDEQGNPKYVIGAVWHEDHYGFHS